MAPKKNTNRDCNQYRASLRIPQTTPMIQRRRTLHRLRSMIRLRCPLALSSTLRHMLRRRRNASRAAVAAATESRRRHRSHFLGVLLLLAAAPVGAPAAAQDEQNDEAADTCGQADDEAQVAVDPGLDFFADRAVLALALCEC
jgi:hypothetical protein